MKALKTAPAHLVFGANITNFSQFVCYIRHKPLLKRHLNTDVTQALRKRRWVTRLMKTVFMFILLKTDIWNMITLIFTDLSQLHFTPHDMTLMGFYIDSKRPNAKWWEETRTNNMQTGMWEKDTKTVISCSNQNSRKLSPWDSTGLILHQELKEQTKRFFVVFVIYVSSEFGLFISNIMKLQCIISWNWHRVIWLAQLCWWFSCSVYVCVFYSIYNPVQKS